MQVNTCFTTYSAVSLPGNWIFCIKMELLTPFQSLNPLFSGNAMQLSRLPDCLPPSYSAVTLQAGSDAAGSDAGSDQLLDQQLLRSCSLFHSPVTSRLFILHVWHFFLLFICYPLRFNIEGNSWGQSSWSSLLLHARGPLWISTSTGFGPQLWPLVCVSISWIRFISFLESETVFFMFVDSWCSAYHRAGAQ